MEWLDLSKSTFHYPFTCNKGLKASQCGRGGINAHCRQPEITDLGCGQSLLNDPDKLYLFTREVVKEAGSKVSVKIRANVPGTDIIGISQSVEDAGADFLHVDAMKPGYSHADYDIISVIKDSTDLFLIGNNSITDIESAQK